MKIGEFFVKNDYITKQALDDALELQEQNKDKRLGELLVDMGAVLKEDLSKYVFNFMENVVDANLADAADWLDQDGVDALFDKYCMRSNLY